MWLGRGCVVRFVMRISGHLVTFGLFPRQRDVFVWIDCVRVVKKDGGGLGIGLALCFALALICGAACYC